MPLPTSKDCHGCKSNSVGLIEPGGKRKPVWFIVDPAGRCVAMQGTKYLGDCGATAETASLTATKFLGDCGAGAVTVLWTTKVLCDCGDIIAVTAVFTTEVFGDCGPAAAKLVPPASLT